MDAMSATGDSVFFREPHGHIAIHRSAYRNPNTYLSGLNVIHRVEIQDGEKS